VSHKHGKFQIATTRFTIHQVLVPEVVINPPDLDDDMEEEKDNNNDECDEEEEDVPLGALGKCKMSGKVLQDGKKQKTNGVNNIIFKWRNSG
jgi:hypothetical protein